VVRTSAAAALGDLRQVITVLREDSAASDRPPEPGFGQLADLLEESRSAGMTLSEHLGLDAGDLPPALGRTAYRVVQEGLTNARKHAPGAPVRVAVRADGGTLKVEVVNLRAPGLAQPTPTGTGAGIGLVGLEERVALAGGRLEHGPNAIGDFVLRATIPGPP
jgi:signal transduction histidine kinase